MLFIRLIRALWQTQQEETQAMEDLRDYLSNLPEQAEKDTQAIYAYMLMCGE